MIRMDRDLIVKQFKWNILILLLNEIHQIKESKCCSLTASKNFSVGLYLDVYEPIWIKLGLMIDISGLYNYFHFFLCCLGLDSKSHVCKKTKTSAPVISQSLLV